MFSGNSFPFGLCPSVCGKAALFRSAYPDFRGCAAKHLDGGIAARPVFMRPGKA
jgi:hypothetical protein